LNLRRVRLVASFAFVTAAPGLDRGRLEGNRVRGRSSSAGHHDAKHVAPTDYCLDPLLHSEPFQEATSDLKADTQIKAFQAFLWPLASLPVNCIDPILFGRCLEVGREHSGERMLQAVRSLRLINQGICWTFLLNLIVVPSQ
jgi:hypothetical protein